MNEKLFSIFFCIYLFWNSILSSFLGQNGIEMEGSFMRLTLVAIFALSVYFFIIIKPRIKGERKVLVFLALFGLLFYSTRFFHNTDSTTFNLYNGQILRWGADCISGCLIGVTLLKLKDYSFIHKILPWLCLLLTPFMAIATLTMGRFEGQMHIDGGLNYQTVAYQMAVLCCFSFYYTFIYDESKGKLLKMITLVAMLIQAVCCMMSGGRGGVVLLVIYALYMIYFLHRNKGVSITKIVLLGVLVCAAIYVVAEYVGLQESSGFARSSHLIEDDDRFDTWRPYFKYMTDNIITGWGLGGDYFTVGFYSHNIFIDLALETGIIGSILFLNLFWKSYTRLYQLTKVNEIFTVVMIFFIYGLVMNCFSGYWITTNSNWMAFGIAFTYLHAYHKQPK